jgi:hypothetical protein
VLEPDREGNERRAARRVGVTQGRRRAQGQERGRERWQAPRRAPAASCPSTRRRPRHAAIIPAPGRRQ